jgi:chorismate mutase / prephenate dehydrogenase
MDTGPSGYRMTLDELRAQLNDIDQQLLELAARRQGVVTEIGRVKQTMGRGTRDFQREREVLLRAREQAAKLGLSPALGESLLHLLIRESLTTQEHASVVAQGRGNGRSALVIGGAGKMGRWFADFLATQGFVVTIADPAERVPGYDNLNDWQSDALEQDLIVVATPIKIANTVLHALALRRPKGVVFDLGSVKSPLRSGLTALKDAGVQTTSIHPMYGPNAQLLSGRHVILIDLGCTAALDRVKELFVSTMAQLNVMTLDEHDRLIAYVLGLSHALNIAFFTALADSGEAAPRLQRLSSTTFDSQVKVASSVSEESPSLYFEIQKLNDFGMESLDALCKAAQQVREVVANNDADAFVAMMQRGREYFMGRVVEGH